MQQFCSKRRSRSVCNVHNVAGPIFLIYLQSTSFKKNMFRTRIYTKSLMIIFHCIIFFSKVYLLSFFFVVGKSPRRILQDWGHPGPAILKQKNKEAHNGPARKSPKEEGDETGIRLNEKRRSCAVGTHAKRRRHPSSPTCTSSSEFKSAFHRTHRKQKPVQWKPTKTMIGSEKTLITTP